MESGPGSAEPVRARWGRAIYTQVKHAVDAQSPVGAMYLMAPGSGQTERGRRGLLARFRDSWQDLRERGEPRLQLLTDREIDPNDPLLSHLDRRTECLVPAIYAAGLPARVYAARQEWAEHLGLDEDGLRLLLAALRLRTGRPYIAELERAETLMWGHGLRTGEQAIAAGVAAVRDWVQQRWRRLNADQLHALVAERTEPAGDQGAILVVEAIDDDPHPEDATELLRWVERYEGDQADSRRELLDAGEWEAVIGPEIEEVGRRLRAAGHRRVIVRGALRLPVWFAVGASLRHVHGFDVAAVQHGAIWASDTATPTSRMPETQVIDLDAGTHLAVAVNVAADATAAVRRFVSDAQLPVARLLSIRPPAGIGPESVPDGRVAAQMAVTMRQSVLTEIDEHPADHIHLFLAAPGGLGLLLGHRWNASRPTTVYEHLGAGRGYAPTVTVKS